jgi:hypothetical protein
MGEWTFFSNYGHVLVCLARNNEARLRDVALEVGITERAVQKIVRDMQDAGFLTVSKHGRRNRYRLNKRKSLRHGLESQCNVGKLLALLARPVPVSDGAEKLDDPAAGPEEVAIDLPSESAPQNAEPAIAAPTPPQEISPKVPDAGKKADKKDKPVDTRQQGSLF